MNPVKILDASFVGRYSLGYGGENANTRPQRITWDRTNGPRQVSDRS